MTLFDTGNTKSSSYCGGNYCTDYEYCIYSKDQWGNDNSYCVQNDSMTPGGIAGIILGIVFIFTGVLVISFCCCHNNKCIKFNHGNLQQNGNYQK